MKNGLEYTPTASGENTERLTARLGAVLERIRSAEGRFGRRPGTVQLLAVSKLHQAQAIADLFACGQVAFGESYVQEALEKMTRLRSLPIEWHFIGPLQSNKTRPVAERFAWVHGVDRLRLAERLSSQRPADLPPLKVCIQVNVSGESSKSGVPPDQVAELAATVRGLPGLELRGLMTIPAPCDQFEEQRKPFRRLRELADELRQSGLALDTLSMGMSDDLEAAIAEGATLVRVGSALFGPRAAR